MSNYYNEWDDYTADWLRNLIKKGLIPDGEVDTRSIVDVRPDDLRGFTQCHFFAGIAGWSYALKLAEWSEDRKIWTGSCPCQPFSTAGKRKGADDERHLWPNFFRLIKSCRPPVVMGEQVAGAAGYDWLDGVKSNLESEDYAIECVDIPACSVNAPHIRQRLFWVANAKSRSGRYVSKNERQTCREIDAPGNANCFIRRNDKSSYGESISVINFWDDATQLKGADGKTRRYKSNIRLLAHGVPARVGKLRSYGNAIVPQLAAEVIRSFMETHK